jgi:hypothetical protein
MFMALSGMIVTQGAVGAPDKRILQFGLGQKIGATGAVVIGVRTGRYKKRALLVAGFDAAAGAVIANALVRSGRR